MSEYYRNLGSRIEERFQGMIAGCEVAVGELTVELPAANLLAVCKALRDEPEWGFEQLMDLCGVDYASYGHGDVQQREFHLVSPAEAQMESEPQTNRPRFAVVYHLLSIANNHRVRLRAYAEGDVPAVPSVINIWSSANWYEREAFDLYGIFFEGHPDLRRILTDYGFIGHPFRKDFPLSGNVEMRYDPDKQRVVYEPVSIEPRVLVPHIIRRDHRYDHIDADGEK